MLNKKNRPNYFFLVFAPTKKYLTSQLVVAILSFSKIICTLFLTLIFEFLRPQKMIKVMHGGHFDSP